MVFPVVIYGCESWTIKQAEHWRIDAFELWRWRRLFRVPWTARRSNWSILKEISSECSLEGLIAEAEIPILWPPDAKNWFTGKDPDAGQDWRQEEKKTEDETVGWHHWLDGHESEQGPEVGDGTGKSDMLHTVHGDTKCRTRLRDWTDLWMEKLKKHSNQPIQVLTESLLNQNNRGEKKQLGKLLAF